MTTSSTTSPMMPHNRVGNGSEAGAARARRSATVPLSFRVPMQHTEGDSHNLHAEVFYLQKQIQSQTPMVIVLEDGERIEGCIEWYDRHALKVRGRSKMLVYKSAIKYMFKLGEAAQ